MFTYNGRKGERFVEQKVLIQQEQRILPNLIQQMDILQMTVLELEKYITSLFLENPVLEFTKPEVPALVAEKKVHSLFIEENLSQNPFNRLYGNRLSDAVHQEETFPLRTSGITLAENLLIQLKGPYASGNRRKICEYLAGDLNHRGFLEEPEEHIAAALNMPQDEVQNCIAYMQTLDPPGICARNLSECLLIQLRQMPGEELDIEKTIVSHHLPLLARNQLPLIAKKLKISVDRVIRAQAKIRSLNPSPAAGFSDDTLTFYIVPDIIVAAAQDGYRLFSNDSCLPDIRISPAYAKLYTDPCCDTATKQYLSEKFRQVRKLQEYIRRRSATLRKIVGYLLDYQKEFFQKGPGYLRPLRLKQASDALQLNPSTVCRAAKKKYLQCSYGLFPLRYFFGKGFLKDENNEIISTETIQAILIDILDKEDRNKPFSDSALCRQLKLRGISLSRRTVAKYRELMHISNSRGRKNFTE